MKNSDVILSRLEFFLVIFAAGFGGLGVGYSLGEREAFGSKRDLKVLYGSVVQDVCLCRTSVKGQKNIDGNACKKAEQDSDLRKLHPDIVEEPCINRHSQSPSVQTVCPN